MASRAGAPACAGPACRRAGVPATWPPGGAWPALPAGHAGHEPTQAGRRRPTYGLPQGGSFGVEGLSSTPHVSGRPSWRRLLQRCTRFRTDAYETAYTVAQIRVTALVGRRRTSYASRTVPEFRRELGLWRVRHRNRLASAWFRGRRYRRAARVALQCGVG